MASLTTNPAQLAEFGWPAAARDLAKLVKGLKPGTTVDISSIQVPDSDLARKVNVYAKDRLPQKTYDHSMRVYYYGKIILQQHFPDWGLSSETLYITCLLHDIGTTKQNMHGTHMSFEFYGAILSLNLLVGLGYTSAQAESVAECIIRHQDLGTTGSQTQLGAIIQLATVFDNVGLNPTLVDTETIRQVVNKHPRNSWSDCFADTAHEEIEAKPWCHSTHIEEFEAAVRGNKLMAPFDGAV